MNFFEIIKKWLDRFLILNVFILILGSVFFIISIFLNFQSISTPLIIFNRLWNPLFIPVISIVVGSTLINIMIIWLKKLAHYIDQDI